MPTTKIASEDLMGVVRMLPDVLFRCYKADDGKIYWSLNEGGLAEQFGLTTKEIKGKSLDELFPGGASDALHEHFELAFQGKPTIFTNEIEGRHFRHFPQPVFDDDGNVKEVVGFIADVTELVEAQEALKAANEELEAFAYSASHDFRGPLSTMRLDAANLLNKLPEGSREHRMAERIQTSADRLAGLVESLLQLSRATKGDLTIRPVNISGVARAVAAELAHRENAHDVEWDIEDDLDIHADPPLAEAMIQNLLENAWKFTRERNAPRITVRRGPEGTIEVADNGPGFPPEEAENIFRSFTRLVADKEGSGIGLATVKRIIERHGGTIEAEGRPDEGATFRFRFGAPTA